MSVNIYARATKLTDVCGRVDYAGNPDRQEHLLATASTVDQDYWKKLAADCQTAFLAVGGKRLVRSKKGKMVQAKCCEARELVIDLPNDAQEREDLQQLALEIVEDFKAQTGADCMAAIHLNHSKNNLHVHLIFSERELLEEPEIRIADRNAFIDEEGRRRRTKKEILDADGQLRPGCRIIPKGEVISERYFGDKNPMFMDKGWLYSYKQEAAAWINERLDPDEKREVFDRFGPYLAQQHVGKGQSRREAAAREWNKLVKAFNDIVKRGYIDREEALRLKTQIALAPDQLLELKAIVADIHCSAFKLPPAQRAVAEALAEQVGKGIRTRVDQDSVRKDKLRDAHRRSRKAWQAYRKAVPGSLDQKKLLADARAISAEISRLERELGYDKPRSTGERRSAVWDAFKEIREIDKENDELQAKVRKLKAERTAAYEEFQYKLAEYQRVKHLPRWRRQEALEELNKAREAYQKAKRGPQMIGKSYELQRQYRTFAQQMASDPSVSQADVDRAIDRYKAAARRLQDPSPEKIKELQRQLSDLQRSHRIQQEKAAARGRENLGAR